MQFRYWFRFGGFCTFADIWENFATSNIGLELTSERKYVGYIPHSETVYRSLFTAHFVLDSLPTNTFPPDSHREDGGTNSLWTFVVMRT